MPSDKKINKDDLPRENSRDRQHPNQEEFDDNSKEELADKERSNQLKTPYSGDEQNALREPGSKDRL